MEITEHNISDKTAIHIRTYVYRIFNIKFWI